MNEERQPGILIIIAGTVTINRLMHRYHGRGDSLQTLIFLSLLDAKVPV